MPANPDPLSNCLNQLSAPLPYILVASLTSSWTISWDLVVGTGSTSSEKLGTFMCLCMHAASLRNTASAWWEQSVPNERGD